MIRRILVGALVLVGLAGCTLPPYPDDHGGAPRHVGGTPPVPQNPSIP